MLCPLTHILINLQDAAREAEAQRLPEVAYGIDVLARLVRQISAERDEAEAAALAQSEAEIAEYEATSGREFDAWAKTASPDQIEAALSAPFQRSVGEIQQQFGVQ